MSASAVLPGSHAAQAHAHEGKFHLFVQLAMILAVITGLELLIIYMPLALWLIITVLMGLSVVKFLCVIFIFMHLRWDKAFCTILFFIGLVLAGGTVGALLLIHIAEASVPVGPAYEQQD
jgi:cytochrome c oxidase subunit IV